VADFFVGADFSHPRSSSEVAPIGVAAIGIKGAQP